MSVDGCWWAGVSGRVLVDGQMYVWAFVLCSVVVCEDNVSSVHSTKW